MKARTAVDELVPLADRLDHLQRLRVVLAVVFASFLVVVPDARSVPWREIGWVTGVYLVGTFVGRAAWRLMGTRNITLFGGLLVVDGFFLAWVTSATGGPASPLRYLVVVHVTALALLASYRTAVRVSLWHSLLTILTLHAVRADLIPARRLSDVGTDYDQAVFFLVLVWLAVLATAAFAALNERELRRRKVDLLLLERLAEALQRAGGADEVVATLEQALIDAYGFTRVVVVHDGSIAGVERKTRLLTELDGELLQAVGPMRNALVTPLFAEGHPVGVVVAEHGMRKDSRIARRVVTMVERFCDHAALALRNAALVEELRAMASTDGLTGTLNRRAFDDALARECARSGRSGEPVSLVLVDLDHFKRLNDVHGHQAGDDALKAAATALRTTSRAGDLVARYGGEEFVVILPNCATDAALEAAERLRAAVAASGPVVPVTASFGVATLPFDAGDPATLIAAADRALYEAKQQGRNRVVAAAARRVRPVRA